MVGLEQLARHPPAQPPLRGVGVVGPVLGERVSGRAAVEVHVLHADQPSLGGLGGGERTGLQPGELGRPQGIGRTHRLVDHGSPAGCIRGECRIPGVPADDFDVVGHAGVPGPLDQSDGLAAAAQRVEGGQADRAGPEYDVSCGGHGVASLGVWDARSDSVSARPGAWRGGRIRWSRNPDRAENVTAP